MSLAVFFTFNSKITLTLSEGVFSLANHRAKNSYRLRSAISAVISGIPQRNLFTLPLNPHCCI